MKNITQTIPKSQKDIIVFALEQRERVLKADIKRYEEATQDGYPLKEYASKEIDMMHRELFDILGLKGLLQYEVSVSMSEIQHDCFTSINHVDYPEFTN